MKKRILCAVLAVMLLLSLAGVDAGRVSAASTMTVSRDGINLLKAFEGFSEYPYWDYSQYTVGYGTRCPDDKLEEYSQNGIPEPEAEALLTTYLEAFCKSINSFADQNGLSLSQNQFDALLLFSFNCGTGWMYETSLFRSAVISGAGGNEFLHAITLWCNAGGSILTGLVRRRLAEANLYLNGVYATTVPQNYCYVRYDANGGKTNPRIQAYDSNLTAAPIPTPEYAGHTFAGWYTSASGGSAVSVLNASVRNATLYAHWDNGQTTAPPEETPSDLPGEAIDPVTVTLTDDDVNLREGPGTDYAVIGSANRGDRFTVTATATAGGYTWGKFSTGWIALNYTDFDDVRNGSAQKPETAQPVSGTVTTYDGLRIRASAGTDSEILGYLSYGTRVEITEQKTAGGMPWGKIAQGWISLTYVKLDEQTQPAPTEPPATEPPATEPPATEPPAAQASTGTVTTDELCIRSGPSTAYSVLGYLYTGDRVTITEQKTSGSMVWGKTDRGWVSLSYVKLDESTQPETPSGGSTSTDAKTGTVTTDELRIRSGAGTTYSVLGYLYTGDRVTITEQQTSGSMVWGKTDRGWVSMDYVLLDGAESGSDARTGTVNADEFLRIRTGPGLSYAVAGYLDPGDRVTVTQTRTADGMTWGKTDRGWISLSYVVFDGETGTETGYVTVHTDCLLIRSAAGTGNTIVGYLYDGAQVQVLERTTAGGRPWGRIDRGWICLDYVK